MDTTNLFGQEQWARRGEDDARIRALEIAPGTSVVTSTTRPANPTVGKTIYETDTGLFRYWNGSGWVVLPGIAFTSGTRPANPSTGEQIYETDTSLLKVWNGSNWVTETNLRMFAVQNGAAGTLSGTPPAIDTGSIAFKIQASTLVATTDAGGLVVVTFDAPFPNGLVTVVVSQGDDTVGDAIVDSSGGGVAGFNIKVHHGGTGAAVNGALMRFNWIAIGW